MLATLRWLEPERLSDLDSEEGSGEAESPTASSVPALYEAGSLIGKADVVNSEGRRASSLDWLDSFSSVSEAPLSGKLLEDHPDHDSSTGDDLLGSSISDTTEFLNVGSGLHQYGTCIPCKMFLAKRGCNIGLKCSFCHYPHEGITRNTLRKRLRAIKKRHHLSEQSERNRYGLAPLSTTAIKETTNVPVRPTML
eukprot:TRINITY_DN3425_c0_g1_i2.p1 TRINITY_DN3425_c0_g1~~TRINITY_DN3425_c0_g1_i2.p1  ORF type:complete len:195 (+),score=14.66 TRINITY_DN3425_c0_g1_i2:109-693(+)